MLELEKLKEQLKAINADAAGIREMAVERRAEFGRRINERRQAVLAQIKEAERKALDVEAEPIDVTAWSGVNEKMPELYSVEMGSEHPLMSELDRPASSRASLTGFLQRSSRSAVMRSNSARDSV